MPPGDRKRPGFGSMLSAVPVPLPDDDDQTAVEPDAPAPEPAPAPAEPPAQPAGPRAPKQGRRVRPDRPKPPQTIRLHDRAGSRLWDAFLAAKSEDPFLTYVEFTSAVVEDGLDRADARRRRS